MLTNPSEGVSGDLSAESIFEQMDRDDSEPEAQNEELEVVSDEPKEVQGEEFEDIDWNGKKYKIPKELKPGLMMQSDYTKKTQALSEQRKAYEENTSKVEAERNYYANQLNHFVKSLGAQIQQMPTEEQILEMSRADPIAAMRLKTERDIKVAQIQQAEQQAYKIHQQQQADHNQKLTHHIEAERTTLMDKVPEWKDEARLNADMSSIAEYARSVGYGDSELGELYDHRAYLILRDAARYRQLTSKAQAQGQQKPAEAPKVLKPGSSQPASDKKLPDSLMKSFKKNPSVENLASIFERM